MRKPLLSDFEIVSDLAIQDFLDFFDLHRACKRINIRHVERLIVRTGLVFLLIGLCRIERLAVALYADDAGVLIPDFNHRRVRFTLRCDTDMQAGIAAQQFCFAHTAFQQAARLLHILRLHAGEHLQFTVRAARNRARDRGRAPGCGQCCRGGQRFRG